MNFSGLLSNILTIFSSFFQTFLDQSGFEFVTRCFQTLENRGLDDQGLYRVVGVASKVTKLLSAGLDKKRSEKINFDEPLEWETKTITSAAKTYLRNLPEPLMTFKMHTSFIAAASKFLTIKGSWFKSSLVYLQYISQPLTANIFESGPMPTL